MTTTERTRVADRGPEDPPRIGGAGPDILVGGAGADIFEIRGAHGAETITDFGEGDRLHIGQGINGLGTLTREGLLARATVLEGEAVIDLGDGASNLGDIFERGLGFI